MPQPADSAARLVTRISARLVVLTLGLVSCAVGPPNTMVDYAEEFEHVRLGMAPADVKAVFDDLHKSSEQVVQGERISEYRFQDGTEPRPGTTAANFERVPHYVYFYFLDDILVSWGEERANLRGDPSLIAEWRTLKK